MWRAFTQTIDNINNWVGKIFGWLLIPISVISLYEVISRYIFDNPTMWAGEINSHLLGVMTFLLGGYVLLRGSHVSVDIFPRMLSTKQKNVLELVLGVLFFVVFGLALWAFGSAAWGSIEMRERSNSILASPLFPSWIIAVIGIVLLFVQGIANFVRILCLLIRAKQG